MYYSIYYESLKCLRFIPCPPGESGFLGSGYTIEEKRKEEDSETSKYDKMAFKDCASFINDRRANSRPVHKRLFLPRLVHACKLIPFYIDISSSVFSLAFIYSP